MQGSSNGGPRRLNGHCGGGMGHAGAGFNLLAGVPAFFKLQCCTFRGLGGLKQSAKAFSLVELNLLPRNIKPPVRLLKVMN